MMATANIEEELTCHVCRELYKDPRFLPCYHSLCKTCLLDLLAKRENTSRCDLRCPSCRHVFQAKLEADIESLPKNFTLASIVRKYQESLKKEDKEELERMTASLVDEEDIEKGSDDYISNIEPIRVELGNTPASLVDEEDIEKGCDDYTSTRESIWENVDYVMVAAIDLGTNSSGWACSFRDEYKENPKNPEKIMCGYWSNSQNMSFKAPTTILVQNDGKTLDKFGYEAEDKYAQFAEDDADELHTWYYFRRFKMLLHRKIRRDMTLESENGKTLAALRVFALAIEYLKNDLLGNMGTKMMDDVDESRFRWILTVPAIWDESVKQFMREAAVKAGIPSNQLTLALEPEAASVYCNMFPLTRANGEASLLHPGAKYVLIDAGGDIIDISAYEVMSDGSLKEIYGSDGCAWGYTEVDKAYSNFLMDFFGKLVYVNFKKKHMEDYLYLCREFEQKKRTIEPSNVSNVTFHIPSSLMELFQNENKQDLAKSILSRGKRYENVVIVSDKIRMDAQIMKGFFADVLQKTRDHLRLLFSGDLLKNVNTIMMVGEFSDSRMLQEMVRTLFSKKRVIVPPQAGLAVLKGAALFGHKTPQ